MRVVTIYILFLFLFFISCEKDSEVLPKKYPYVITKDPVVKEEGATFFADIVDLGDQKVIQYGFVWSEDDPPNILNNRKIFESDAKTGTYTYTLNAGLIKGQTYYIRAYILTEKYEVYGNIKSFSSLGSLPPEITGFDPKFGPIGTQVVIEGKNFALSKTGNIVKFGNTVMPVDSAFDNRIFVTIPNIIKSEKVPIAIETAGMTTNSVDSFELWFPWKRMKDFSEGYNGLVSFSIQDKAYLGLGDGITDFWEYDLNNESFIKKINFPHPINAVPKCFVIDNRGYVVFSNGNNHYPGTSTITELWEYNSTEDSWTRKADFPGKNRNDAVAFTINNKGYFVTGEYHDEFGYLYYPKDFWEYNPSSNSWTQKADFPGDDRARAFGFSIGTNGYVGIGATGWSQKNLYKYNQQSNTWTYIGEYPGNGFNYVNGFIIDNKCYLGLGGNNSGDSYSDFWEFDPADNSWKKMRSCLVGMDASMAFSINNKGYIGIGLQDYMDHEDYRKIIYEFDPLKN